MYPVLFNVATYATMTVMGWANVIMGGPERLIHVGQTVAGTIDCAKSAENGIQQSANAPSPSKLCFQAGNITSQIIGVSEAHADQIALQSLPKVASSEPRVPIAQ